MVFWKKRKDPGPGLTRGSEENEKINSLRRILSGVKGMKGEIRRLKRQVLDLENENAALIIRIGELNDTIADLRKRGARKK